MPTSAVAAEVVKIVPGDSFRMKLRGDVLLVSLAGIVAPDANETRWPRNCYAEQSRAQQASVLPVGTALLVDPERAAEHGLKRISAVLWFADLVAQRAFLINELIVAHGDAVADPEIDAELQMAVNEARVERAGLSNVGHLPPTTPAT